MARAIQGENGWERVHSFRQYIFVAVVLTHTLACLGRFGMAVPMLAGSSAGVVARVLCHPIDTIKSKLQVEVAADRASWSSVLRRTLRCQGAAGLYRGVGVAVVGSCPAACLYFTSYETLKERLRAHTFCNGYPFLADFAAGFGAEAVACILFVPIDVIKERLQVQGTMLNAAQYASSLDACRTIIRVEGLAGIYKGYWATLASFGPFSALYFLFYEQFKSAHAQHLASRPPSRTDVAKKNGIEKEPIPSAYTLVHGAAAGGLASFLTNGLDMAKLRLQVQRGVSAAIPGAQPSAASFQYSGFMDALACIIRSEGFKGLFKGAGARVLFFMPSQAISIASFEYFKSFYANVLFKSKELEP